MLSFVVDKADVFQVYEVIGHTQPTEIKGTYFTYGGTNQHKIDIIIQDPNKEIVFKRTDEVQGIITFNTTIPGEYTFIFANLGDSVYEKACSFALHTYEEIKEPIKFDINEKGERFIVYDPKISTDDQQTS